MQSWLHWILTLSKRSLPTCVQEQQLSSSKRTRRVLAQSMRLSHAVEDRFGVRRRNSEPSETLDTEGGYMSNASFFDPTRDRFRSGLAELAGKWGWYFALGVFLVILGVIAAGMAV